jgi:hypothetical protein
MRVAIAVTSSANETYDGPLGHAPFFAIYEKQPDGWRRIELRDNPYKALEGGGKGRLLARLLADCGLWLAVGHGRHEHERPGEHHGSGRRVVAEKLREIDPASSVAAVLAALEV